MSTRRTLAALVLAPALLAAPLAHAAPSTKPQLTDPSGDALAPGFDVVSAQLTTTGTTTTRKAGRRTVRTYTPKNLVARVTLAEAPSTTPGTSIQLHVDMTACDGGFMEFQYTPGALISAVSEIGDVFVSGCGSDSGAGPSEYIGDVLAEVKGSTISWVMPLTSMGADLPLSTVFSGFKVQADVNEPVMGLAGGYEVGAMTEGAAGDIDYASSDATWKLG